MRWNKSPKKALRLQVRLSMVAVPTEPRETNLIKGFRRGLGKNGPIVLQYVLAGSPKPPRDRDRNLQRRHQGQFEGGDPTGGRGRGGTSLESHSATELPKKGIRSTVAATTRSLVLTIFSSLSAAGVTSITGGTAGCTTG
jgi:hypothetical protein